jgi:hypothetical protein
VNHEMRQPVSLLHNMSCRPTRAITRTNSDRCVRLAFGPSHIRERDGRSPILQYWNDVFGLTECPSIDDRRRLSELAAGHPKLAMLPPVCAVAPGTWASATPGYSDDPGLTLAVLLRAPGHVFLRDRSPVFLDEAVARDVTLVLPPDWRRDP